MIVAAAIRLQIYGDTIFSHVAISSFMLVSNATSFEFKPHFLIRGRPAAQATWRQAGNTGSHLAKAKAKQAAQSFHYILKCLTDEEILEPLEA